MTPYAQALLEYHESNRYIDSVRAMSTYGMIQPYIGNILDSAFAEGWNSKPTPDAK